MSDEQKPKAEESDFERRFREEQEVKAAQAKEREYQIFKLQKEFGLDMDIYARWQQEYPMGISLIWIQEHPYIYRPLLLSEYEAIVEMPDASVSKNQERIAEKGTVWPKLGDFRSMEAGISATLAQVVITRSAFGADFEPIAI